MKSSPITTLFIDIGGVLLTNGWDRHMRKEAAEIFKIDYDEMNERHHLTFDTFEVGKISLDEYITRVVFHEPRNFTREDFRDYIYKKSRPYQNMIDLITTIRRRNHVKVAAVSNEGRELTEYRTRKFQLRNFVDFFVVSSFVHFRKPDPDIYRIALDIAQAEPQQVVYIDDRAMFIEIAQGVGIHGIHHVDYESTRKALESYGLSVGEQEPARETVSEVHG